MKVILIQDVARLGQRSEVKDVPNGHALNFLIPRKLAIPATPENLRRHSAWLEQKESERNDAEEAFKSVLESLRGKTVTHKASANEKGHLFSGINSDVISKLLKEEGHDVLPDDIVLDHPIKEIGSFEITLKRGEQHGPFTLEVTAE